MMTTLVIIVAIAIGGAGTAFATFFLLIARFGAGESESSSCPKCNTQCTMLCCEKCRIHFDSGAASVSDIHVN